MHRNTMEGREPSSLELSFWACDNVKITQPNSTMILHSTFVVSPSKDSALQDIGLLL